MALSSMAKGVVCAVLAYILWGILPLYWKLLSFASPLHILAFRILFSLFFVGIILLLGRNSSWIRLFTDPKKRSLAILSGLVITFNWGLYIWAVNTGHTIESSLGYYINPLISILLGLIFFKEKLGRLQWVAFALACLGVLVITLLSGTFPWISLCLALSFGFYGLLKKKLASGSLESLGAETLAAAPIGIALLIFPPNNLGDLTGLSIPAWAGLVSCGIITALPLFLFGLGAKLLPLSTLGFIQFISPTFQFFLGIFVFGESFPIQNLAAFGLIWVSVILYSVSLRIKPQ
ncbi:EamA family transporter RarD [Treponema primitia]|uniref:EamA family transporter RarD n=1 Tax=Treponema primitia TaxID=88058 RepID=UPI0002D7D529|nr:EamA family transporter RarD [Treponema primitia]